MAAAVVVKITIELLFNYPDYYPPNFNADFLIDREDYFWGWYSAAFYLHLISSPPAMLMGLILISHDFKSRFPRWHGWLGKIQVYNLLLFVVPSGLGMSLHAQSGVIAGIGFFLTGIVTAFTACMGWYRAVKKQFASHKRWMWRCFLMLCSAVVIRVLGGLFVFCGFTQEWLYPLAAWVSGFGPILVYECGLMIRNRRWLANSRVSMAPNR